MSGWRPGWRLALRLARREAWRHRAQTVLMLTLICLPVLAVSAAAVVWKTTEITGDEAVERRLGGAEALVALDPDAGRVLQMPDPDDGQAWWGDGGARPSTLADVQRVLGGSRPTVEVRTTGEDIVEHRTERGRAPVQVMEADFGDPLTAGLIRPVAGQFPPGPGEVVVNQALAERGPGIGDELEVSADAAEGAVRLRVVGIAEHGSIRTGPVAAALPGAFGLGEFGGRTWLVGGDPVTWQQVLDLNRLGALVTSRAVLANPPAKEELPAELGVAHELLTQEALTVLVLVVVMVLIEVVLLAGPAFAVRARKQAHSLALLAAAGGEPAQARRVVMASGVVIGAAGGLFGALGGILLGYLALPLVQRVSDSYLGPFDVPWHLLGLVACFGFVSALLAAVVPARIASRQDVVAVLAGRRGEGHPSRRSPLLGLLLLGLGLALAVMGVRRVGPQELMVGGSAIVSVLGMILLVPLVVVAVARLAARMPLPVRFAARDAARHRTRTVPAVAAVAATVAGVVALGIAVASDEAASSADYEPRLPHGHAMVAGDGDTALAPARDVIGRRLPGAPVTTVLGMGAMASPSGGVELTFRSEGQQLWYEAAWSFGVPALVGRQVPDTIASALTPDDRRLADATLRDGGVVVLGGGSEEPARELPDLRLVVHQYDGGGDVTDITRLPVAGVVVPVSGVAPAPAVVPREVAAQLGLAVAPAALVVKGGIDRQAERDLAESLAAMPGGLDLYVERGYQTPDEIWIIQLVLGVLAAVLMLGGTLTATFLALSDARPDLATMAAVGARARTRRGVAGAYALVVGLVGATLGAPVGFIPGIAITYPLTRGWEGESHVLDVPWLLIGAVVAGLPLLTAAVVGLCARSRLPMAARID